jgi:glycosyltransferase involved in cell wall biosynthesis
VPVERFRYVLPESAQDVCYSGGALFNLKGSPLTAAKLPALIAAQTAAIRKRVGAYDLVSAHWLIPQGWTAVQATRGTGVPVVSTVHGSDVFGLTHPVLQRFKRATLGRTAAVTVNSTATRDAVLELGADAREVQLIPMGADVDVTADPVRVARWREQRRGDGPLVAFVGRLIDWKGVDDLLTAIPLVAQTLPDVTLVVAGSGPQREQLEARTAELGIGDRVQFAGWLDRAEVTALQAAADVVSVPSRTAADGSREAQGLSVVEAMALARPVVASDVGGIPDAIRDGVNGLLVPERNPPAIARSILRLHAEPELAGRLGAAAQETAQARYSWRACIERFTEVFDAAVARRR